MDIRRFFQSKEDGTPATDDMNGLPAKRAIAEQTEPLEKQTFKRSAKSLVKAKTRSTVVASETSSKRISPRKTVPKSTPIEEDAAFEEIPSTPVKRARNSSAVVADSPSPKKTKEEAGIAVQSKPTGPLADDGSAAVSPEKTGFNYRAYLQKRAVGPKAPGSKEIPVGSPNCLEGLTFVFTGELSSLSREDASDIVKRYGGKVTSAPSRKTNYVVLGEEPGPSKLKKIEELELHSLDEDEFLDLIKQRSVQTPATPLPASALAQSTEPSRSQIANSKKASPRKQGNRRSDNIEPSDEHANPAETNALWTDKYAPKSVEDLIGNHSLFEKLAEWLRSWTSSSQYHAALLSGPPGIGKTTCAKLACSQEGFDMVEFNASDTRSKTSLQEQVSELIDNTSISGFFGKASRNDHTRHKQVLIMDEVDGMSAGDRGGMAELILLIKKTKVPIICICNDRANPKVRSLVNYCLDLRFRRPDSRMILPRLSKIASHEGLQLQANTIEELVASTQADIRQIINLLSIYRLTQPSMSFDQSKTLSVEGRKDADKGPFDAIAEIFSGNFWSRHSLAEKMDIYFVDSSLVPLMVQENYLKSKPTNKRQVIGVGSGSGGGHDPNLMELYSAAADSFSDADLVEALIRGYNQEWSLSPFHAVMSCVRPAYYTHGSLGGRIDFAGWLGHNSRQAKYSRLLRELLVHSSLHVSADKNEFRQSYAPTLSMAILAPLKSKGQAGIEETIEILDRYSLTKDDSDSLLELMLHCDYDTTALAKIPTAVKSAFTRKYNQGTRKLPYSLGALPTAQKVLADVEMTGEQPEADIVNTMIDENEVEGEESSSLDRDKMIKAKPAKAKAGPSLKSKRGGKAGK